MFDRFFHSKPVASGEAPASASASASTSSNEAGDTATVRRIVAKLEAMPPEQARLVAAAAYTLARAANADLDISDEETTAIERELQAHEALDEATAVLVTEMAKLQAKTVGGTEDFVVTREFKALADETQRLVVLRACFAVMAANGSISAEENAIVNQIAGELDIDQTTLNSIRADYHDQLSSVQQIRRVTGGA
ncbi:MAG: TerB family tellurite resistance protein [Chloroflexota bacterium]